MRYLSVCSGIEAATVAWHPLGWEPVAFAEIDKFPSAVLAHHYPHVPNMGDFTTIKAADVGPIDVLVGGTPCQSFSVAGLRAGLADDRGNLALEFLRLADRMRPKWLVWENVPGVLSSNGGRDFGSILGGLVELRYGFAYRVLDAQFFGVPQRRRRVFLVGCLGDWRRAAAVLFERHSLQGHSTPRRKAGQGVAGTVDASSGGCDENDARDDRLTVGTLACNTGPNGHDAGNFASNQGVDAGYVVPVARCVTAGHGKRYDGESETFVTHALTQRYDSSEDGCGRGTPIIPIQPAQTVRDKKQNGIGIGGAGDEMFTLTGRDQHAIAFGAQMSTPHWQNGLSDTLQAKNPKAVASGAAVRRLTPRECERLQGFPDDYTLIPYRGKRAQDGPRYKALGNSMAVPVMGWIGERIARTARPQELKQVA